MNTFNPHEALPGGRVQREKSIDLTGYLDVLMRYRWTFILIAGTVFALGATYAFFTKSVYRTDIVVQVEDTGNSANTKLAGSVAPVFDVKPAAAAEIELLHSRMVVGKAVESLKLFIDARPSYFPVIGQALARYNPGLSEPGLFGWGGFVWGDERITVGRLDMPTRLEGTRMTVTALDGKRYRLNVKGEQTMATGTVGQPLLVPTSRGNVEILITELEGNPGATFHVTRLPRAIAIAQLQQSLQIAERGKSSGVIGITLEGPDPDLIAATLNEIGSEYVDQNVRRRAEEAEKSLAFLDQQLPQVKQQVETAETRYNALRNQRGTIDLGEESKLILSQSVQIQTRLQELRAKRQELVTRFTGNHPSIGIIDEQIGSLNAALAGVTTRIQKLPEVEQNVLRLLRDVKVSTELYQSLLNDAQQLKLTKASKVGTARMVDPAEVPLQPVRPNRSLLVIFAAMLGTVGALIVVCLRHMLDGGVAEADDIENLTGFTVYSTIPFSPEQSRLATQGNPKAALLACRMPDDPAMESLRSFRTALQFSLLGNRHPVVLVTGPAPGVGKSFICANFAAVLAAGGKRVVLIDADLRRGNLNRRFDTDRGPGLTELLQGAPVEPAVRRQVVPGLDFIPTGTLPEHPADLLLSPAMDALLNALKANYDIVLIDTPPVLAASDTGILATKADAVFMVARADSTTVDELEAAGRAIRQVGGEVKGVLFNGLNVQGRWYRAHYNFGKYRYLNYRYQDVDTVQSR
ncbi:polysaccharide biosynthesis tyrosine autokinase [Cupriavidus basilensis]|uniref:polysaccharide biosynthesis tyrosine autokinase n=1 Tax=Cupriavidus basilensis TaxID=68895 RepID=UPI0020A668A4|nr:polysaccharide biosynthesis tyrosine autokinase [Cupriavidus basilensis]MCP3019154.1 polysaccharide biosynthesis tyrosine autokinase [Cupriavidus basilensis]MDR3379830.1 polysaccharide biosynthesis tyrosine autokinase [Cupriavidus basilensis]